MQAKTAVQRIEWDYSTPTTRKIYVPYSDTDTQAITDGIDVVCAGTTLQLLIPVTPTGMESAKFIGVLRQDRRVNLTELCIHVTESVFRYTTLNIEVSEHIVQSHPNMTFVSNGVSYMQFTELIWKVADKQIDTAFDAVALDFQIPLTRMQFKTTFMDPLGYDENERIELALRKMCHLHPSTPNCNISMIVRSGGTVKREYYAFNRKDHVVNVYGLDMENVAYNQGPELVMDMAVMEQTFPGFQFRKTQIGHTQIQDFILTPVIEYYKNKLGKYIKGMRTKRMVAIAMSLHCRLGEKATTACLPETILESISQMHD